MPPMRKQLNPSGERCAPLCFFSQHFFLFEIGSLVLLKLMYFHMKLIHSLSVQLIFVLVNLANEETAAPVLDFFALSNDKTRVI